MTVLSAGLASGVDEVAVTMLDIIPVLFGTTTIVKPKPFPGFNKPALKNTTPLVTVPDPLSEAVETNVTPAGSRLLITTFDADPKKSELLNEPSYVSCCPTI